MPQATQNGVLQCYFKALNNYRKKTQRAGCSPTFFTPFRHSFKEYSRLEKLRKALEFEQDIDIALILVVEHLFSKKSTFNNHSFNNYFLDELRKSFPYIEWDGYTPKAIKKYTAPPLESQSERERKQVSDYNSNYCCNPRDVKRYETLLYRGDSRDPKLIFKSGFEERQTSDFDSDYLKYCTGRIGISTTKKMETAEGYPRRNKWWDKFRKILDKIGLTITKKPPSLKTTYIYAIDYRGADGFDILKTGQARGVNHSLSFYNYLFHRDRYRSLNDKDEEVNIKGKIPPEQITGVFKVTKDGMFWTENPDYVKESDWPKMYSPSL